MQSLLNSKRLAKIIWQEIKRPFRRKLKIMKMMNELRANKSKIDTVFGSLSEISKSVDPQLRTYRWRLIFGKRIPRFLRVSEPRSNRYGLFTQHVGIDIEKAIQSTDEAWILDGIKLPNVCACEYELPDIAFPAYLRRRSDIFEDYCALVGEHLGDFNEGPYEYGNVCLKEGDVVFDCGANMGMFSAVASRYGCQSFAFEAIPETIDKYLSKTVSMNENIHVYNFAVWDKEETLTFSLEPHRMGAARADLLYHCLPRNRKQFAVPAITLDAFVEKHGIERVDFIKADIEGAERNMLRGATRILKKFAPKLSICTYHLPDDPKVLREIILEANPKYQIVEKFSKMYAHVP